MATTETELPLKLMVDSKRNKVIFAEAGSDFVDVLLSFLTLPLGTIVRRLNQHFGTKTSALGCFNNLYSSVESFNDSDFVCKEDRQMLLHPKNASHSPWLKLKIDDSQIPEISKCTNLLCTKPLISNNFNALCSCGYKQSTSPSGVLKSSKGRVFTNSKKSFIITDDLRLIPSQDGFNFILAQNLAIDVDEFKEVTISVGLNEIMHLFQWSLISPTPLTNLLHWHLKCATVKQPSFRSWAPKLDSADQLGESGKIVIKALVQKSTDRVIFFQVGVDFVGFLFKLLTIPLGSAVLLSGGNSGLGSIDNLYTSVAKLSNEYLVSSKYFLLNPKMVLYDKNSSVTQIRYKVVSLYEKSSTPDLGIIDPMLDRQIIGQPSMFMVTDDLIVTPSSTVSIFLHLQSRKICVSDVKELAINIGKKEALDILKASLVSNTSVLSKALHLMKQPKKEK